MRIAWSLVLFVGTARAFAPRPLAVPAVRPRERCEVRASSDDVGLAGAGAVGIVSSLGVLWSEFAGATTGCGPAELPDPLERASYLVVLGFAGAGVFSRTAFACSATAWIERATTTTSASLAWIRAAEVLALAAVAGALVALEAQVLSGQNIWRGGLAGIDPLFCAP